MNLDPLIKEQLVTLGEDVAETLRANGVDLDERALDAILPLLILAYGRGQGQGLRDGVAQAQEQAQSQVDALLATWYERGCPRPVLNFHLKAEQIELDREDAE